jgi:hypothetical protein
MGLFLQAGLARVCGVSAPVGPPIRRHGLPGLYRPAKPSSASQRAVCPALTYASRWCAPQLAAGEGAAKGQNALKRTGGLAKGNAAQPTRSSRPAQSSHDQPGPPLQRKCATCRPHPRPSLRGPHPRPSSRARPCFSLLRLKAREGRWCVILGPWALLPARAHGRASYEVAQLRTENLAAAVYRLLGAY